MKVNLVVLTVCVALASCDTGTKEAEGTSSETHTSLQALADSLAEVGAVRPGFGDGGVAGRSLVSTGVDAVDSSLIRDNVHAWYGFDPEHASRVVHKTSTRFTVLGPDSVEMLDSVWWVNGKVDVLFVRKTRMRPGWSAGAPVVLDLYQGRTRSGFRYSSKSLTETDRQRLRLDRDLYATDPLDASKDAKLFSLGDEWEAVVPWDLMVDSFPIFRRDTLKGWIAKRFETPFVRPVLDFEGYRVCDLDGRCLDPRPIPRTTMWIADSLGVFWGEPRLDSTGSDLHLPVHWRFLPGSLEGVSELAQEGIVVLDLNDSLWPREAIRPLQDTGSGEVVVRGVASRGELPMRWLQYFWWVPEKHESLVDLENVQIPAFPR